jgi:hypothetical protein
MMQFCTIQNLFEGRFARKTVDSENHQVTFRFALENRANGIRHLCWQTLFLGN